MKNLITKYTKGLSLKEIKTSKENRRDPYDLNRSVYHTVDGVSPYKRIKRICETYIGKQFNKAFSEYCSQVPIYQQRFFLDEFKRKPWHNEYWTYYFVDKQGNIQKHIGKYSKKGKKVYYYSDDYKTEKRHKDTGQTMPYFWLKRKGKHSEENYVETIVSGYCLEFSSRKDPEWIRLTSDQRKRRKAAEREIEKAKTTKAYSFISKSEKELMKDKAANRVKIESKGFDYETSFRKDGEINPDVIKEKQGFKK